MPHNPVRHQAVSPILAETFARQAGLRGSRASILLVACGLVGIFGNEVQAQPIGMAPAKVDNHRLEASINRIMMRFYFAQANVVCTLSALKSDISLPQFDGIVSAISDYAVDQKMIGPGDNFRNPRSEYSRSVVMDADEAYNTQDPVDRGIKDRAAEILLSVAMDVWGKEDEMPPSRQTFQQAERGLEGMERLSDRIEDILANDKGSRLQNYTVTRPSP